MIRTAASAASSAFLSSPAARLRARFRICYRPCSQQMTEPQLIRVVVCADYRLVTALWIETRHDQPAHTGLARGAERHRAAGSLFKFIDFVSKDIAAKRGMATKGLNISKSLEAPVVWPQTLNQS